LGLGIRTQLAWEPSPALSILIFPEGATRLAALSASSRPIWLEASPCGVRGARLRIQQAPLAQVK
jgi:hypothetical protein